MIALDSEKPKRELVPLTYPYGSITDGDWVCGRCNESKTGCGLCAGEPVWLVPYRGFQK